MPVQYSSPPAAPVYRGPSYGTGAAGGGPDCTEDLVIGLSVFTFAAGFSLGAAGVAVVQDQIAKYNYDEDHYRHHQKVLEGELDWWCMAELRSALPPNKGWGLLITSFTLFLVSFLMMEAAGAVLYGMKWFVAPWQMRFGRAVAYTLNLIGFSLYCYLFDYSNSIGCGLGGVDWEDREEWADMIYEKRKTGGNLSLDAGSALVFLAMVAFILGWALIFRDMKKQHPNGNIFCIPKADPATSPDDSAGDVEIPEAKVKEEPETKQLREIEEAKSQGS